jgi:hypothetical protein
LQYHGAAVCRRDESGDRLEHLRDWVRDGLSDRREDVAETSPIAIRWCSANSAVAFRADSRKPPEPRKSGLNF